MGNDARTTYVVEFDQDNQPLLKALTGLKAAFRDTTSDLQAQAARLDLLGPQIKQAKDAATAFFDTRKRVEELKTVIEATRNAGGVVSPELARSLKDAERAAAQAEKAFDSQRAKLQTLRDQLKSAGIDTRNLGDAQAKLAAQITEANKAASVSSSKDVLGLKTIGDVEPQIQKVTAALNTLRQSGKLSGTELAAAQKLAQAEIERLRGSVQSLGTSSADMGRNLKGAFVNFATTTLLPIATLTTVAAGIKAVSDASREYESAQANIGTVTNLSTDELRQLGDQARKVAGDVGVDLTGALKSLYEIIRSGTSPNEAVEALRITAEASKAQLVDMGTAAKATNNILSGFGSTVGELRGQIDAVIAGAHRGGPTLREFADGAGPLLTVARAANVDFNQLVATLAVMTNATNDAGGSISTLQKIILGLNTADARARLRELGIESTNLVDIFAELGKRGLGVDQILGLGIASTKAAAGVTALTSNSKELPTTLEAIASSAGQTAKDVDAFAKTANERAEQLDAQWTRLKVNFGKGLFTGGAAAASGDLLRFLSDAQEGLTGLETNLANAQRSGATFGERWQILTSIFRGGAEATNQSAAETNRLAAAATNAANATRLAAAQSDDARKTLEAGAKSIAANAAELTRLALESIGSINQRADAEVAALDKSSAASADTAAKTTQILTDAAAAREKILRDTEARVTAATDTAIASREAIARRSGQTEASIARDTAQQRIAALAPILAAYSAHQAQLVGLAQAAAAKIQSIDREREQFAFQTQDRLLQLQQQTTTSLGVIASVGMSQLDLYVHTLEQAQAALREEAIAAENGDLERAKLFHDRAIALSDRLQTVIGEKGNEIISSFKVQSDKIDITKRAADEYFKALDKVGDAAKNGRDKTVTQLDDVRDHLSDLQGEFDNLRESLAEDIEARVSLDQGSVNDATATLDALSRPRTVQLNVVTTEQKAAGGFVGQSLAARFANGGRVFRPLLARKVPGVGSQDTEPALLRAGSFVVKKSASQFYGDGIMARLAGGGTAPTQRFARGGLVQRLASGGNVVGTAARTDSGTDAIIDFTGRKVTDPRLPDDPDALRRLAETYARNVENSARPNFRFWGEEIRNLDDILSRYEAQPTTDKLQLLIERSRRMGLNLGAPYGKIDGYDIDGRKWHRVKVPNLNVFDYQLFQKGGAVAKLAGGGFGMNDRSLGTQPDAPQPNKPNVGSDGFVHLPDLFPGGKDAGAFGGSLDQVGGISAPRLPSDFETLRRAVLEYAAKVGNFASRRPDFWRAVLDALAIDIKTFNRVPTEDNLFVVLNRARNIGLNLGTPTGTLDGFDIDNRKWHAVRRSIQRGEFGFGQNQSIIDYQFYGRGGNANGGDTVPAMLTPGEWVVNPSRVRQLGAGFMQAVNSMLVSKDQLASMLAPSQPVAKFATGGPVTGSAMSFVAPPITATIGTAPPKVTPIVANFYLAESVYGSREHVQRHIVPALDRLARMRR